MTKIFDLKKYSVYVYNTFIFKNYKDIYHKIIVITTTIKSRLY